MFSIESLGSFLIGLFSTLSFSIGPTSNKTAVENQVATNHVHVKCGNSLRNLEEGTFSEEPGTEPKLEEVVICKDDGTSEIIPV